MWDRRAEYVRNHDGDSVVMNLDKGEGLIQEEYSVRLLNVWCPEIDKHEPGAVECREFVTAWFKKHKIDGLRWSYVVYTSRMKIADKEQKTYERYVGTITNLDGTANLNGEIAWFVRQGGWGGGTGAPR